MTPDEAKSLILACSATPHTGIRNRALITVMYRGGLRLGEALDLRPMDIDQQLGTITVLHGKEDRRRVVGIDPEAMSLIPRWIDKLRELDVAPQAGPPISGWVGCYAMMSSLWKNPLGDDE